MSRVKTFQPQYDTQATPKKREAAARRRAAALREIAGRIGTRTVAERVARKAVLKEAADADERADYLRHWPGCIIYFFGDGDWGDGTPMQCTCGADQTNLHPHYKGPRS